jgi:hypothetical protein
MPTNKNLSKDPANVRKRIRRREVPLMRDMKTLASARKPIEEWDTEELARGRPRDKDGHFRGPSPKWITTFIMAEAKRRLQADALSTLGSYVLDAVKVIHDLMMSTARDDNGKPIVDAKTRLAAAMFIIEHTVGKPRQAIDVSADGDGYKAFLAGALKMVDTEGRLVDAHPVIEGDVVDEEGEAE